MDIIKMGMTMCIQLRAQRSQQDEVAEDEASQRRGIEVVAVEVETEIEMIGITHQDRPHHQAE
jgi:hypothetical protein